jgi:hypothetical protein
MALSKILKNLLFIASPSEVLGKIELKEHKPDTVNQMIHRVWLCKQSKLPWQYGCGC